LIYLNAVLEPELQDLGIVVAFKGPVCVSEKVIVHKDVIEHKPGMA
jgi:hypothetical protein